MKHDGTCRMCDAIDVPLPIVVSDGKMERGICASCLDSMLGTMGLSIGQVAETMSKEERRLHSLCEEFGPDDARDTANAVHRMMGG